MWSVIATKKGKLPISVEKRPKGKVVTVVANVSNSAVLLSELKTKLGSGGVARASCIEIQGDQEDRVSKFLLNRRNLVHHLSTSLYPFQAEAFQNDEQGAQLKVRSKPRWSKTKAAGVVVLCDNPGCSWRFCTSKIVGYCGEDGSEDNDDWYQDTDYSAEVLDSKQHRETILNEDQLQALGMLPSPLQVDRVPLSSRKAKVAARQQERSEMLTKQAAQARHAPPPVQQHNRHHRSGRRRRGGKQWSVKRSARRTYYSDDAEDAEEYEYISGSETAGGSFESPSGYRSSVGYGSGYNRPVTTNVAKEEVIDTSRLTDEQVLQYATNQGWTSLFHHIVVDTVEPEWLPLLWRLVIQRSKLLPVEEVFLLALEECLSQAKESEQPWTCPTCTYENKSIVLCCTMCGCLKDTETVDKDKTNEDAAKLVQMGFEADKVESSLNRTNGDIDAALELLLTGL